MKGLRSVAALTLGALIIVAGGCVSPEQRMHVAASRDESRRAAFEHCRAEGRIDCDAILNEPVNSNTYRRDSIRDQEARAAYERCIARNGSDCDDLLPH